MIENPESCTQRNKQLNSVRKSPSRYPHVETVQETGLERSPTYTAEHNSSTASQPFLCHATIFKAARVQVDPKMPLQDDMISASGSLRNRRCLKVTYTVTSETVAASTKTRLSDGIQIRLYVI